MWKEEKGEFIAMKNTLKNNEAKTSEMFFNGEKQKGQWNEFKDFFLNIGTGLFKKKEQ